jgi:hypothetical protein
MIHVIRLNVAGVGYDTFMWRSGVLSRIPLGQSPPMTTSAESASIGKNLRRLDTFLSGRSRPWTMAFTRVWDGGPIAVGYGGRVEAEDDKGRSGLRFAHVILCEDEAAAIRITWAVLGLLSIRQFAKFSTGIASVARGRESPEGVIQFILDTLSPTAASNDVPNPAPSPIELRGVVHDIAGAAPVAWLTLLIQQSRRPAPWEIYDSAGSSGDDYTTLCSPAAGDLALASRLVLPLAQTTDAAPKAKDRTGTESLVAGVSTVPRSASADVGLVDSDNDAGREHDESTDQAAPSTVLESTNIPRRPDFRIAVGLATGGFIAGAFLLPIANLNQRLSTAAGIVALLSLMFLSDSLRSNAATYAGETQRQRLYRQIGLRVCGLVVLACIASLNYVGSSPNSTAATYPSPIATAPVGTEDVSPLADTVAVLGKTRESVKVLIDSLQSAKASATAVRDTLRAVRQTRDSAFGRAERLQRQLDALRQLRGPSADSTARSVNADTSGRTGAVPL